MYRNKWPTPPQFDGPYFGPPIYSGVAQSTQRTLREMPPTKPPSKVWPYVKFPIITLPPDVPGTVGGWTMIAKPNVRPYYKATVIFADDMKVNFMVDPEANTSEHELQERIDERVREVSAFVRRRRLDAAG